LAERQRTRLERRDLDRPAPGDTRGYTEGAEPVAPGNARGRVEGTAADDGVNPDDVLEGGWTLVPNRGALHRLSGAVVGVE
jgi:hypothetical protein